MTTATLTETTDSRLANFTQAYLEMGCSPDYSAMRGAECLMQDENSFFTVEACTNQATAKETVYLLEAIHMLCAGELYHSEALALIDRARAGIAQ